MSANDRQEGGTHYKKYQTEDGLQHWDLAAAFRLDYFQGVITKYIFRWRDKDGISALRKASHYLEKYIECEENGYSIETVRSIVREIDDMYREPVPMLLFCPKCHAQHVDAPYLAINWKSTPHRSHKCMVNGCGYTWRPADVPTVGVREIKTAGKNDDDPLDAWYGKHRTTPAFCLEGFKEGYALYRCQHPGCREHFKVPLQKMPAELHDCPYPTGNGGMIRVPRFDVTNPSHGERASYDMANDNIPDLHNVLTPGERLGIDDLTDTQVSALAHGGEEPDAAYVDQAHDRAHVTRAGERRCVTLAGIVDARVIIRRAADRPRSTFETPVGG